MKRLSRNLSFAVNRRNFLKNISITGGVTFLGMGGIFTLYAGENVVDSPFFCAEYSYRTISVSHVEEISKWYETLRKGNIIGKNKIFREYINNLKFEPEEILPGAKSIIIFSRPQKIYSVIYEYKGQKYKMLFPTGYVSDGGTISRISEILQKDLNLAENEKPEWSNLPLKILAVRSGLAKYGKNNVTYTSDYGSNHQLMGFYTRKELPDNWGPLKMMRLCKGCSICLKACLTECISKDNFVINVDKCVTLYNETDKPIPSWMPPEMHNTLVGCLKCQGTCPANSSVMNNIENLAEISERETLFLLSDKTDNKMHENIKDKLKRFPSIGDLEYFRRNFKLVFENSIIS